MLQYIANRRLLHTKGFKCRRLLNTSVEEVPSINEEGSRAR